MNDPYSILGVARNATEKEIKTAFRKRAKECHPDSHPNDAKAKEKFTKISQAYEILGDKEKRAQFDRGDIDAEGRTVHPGFSQQGFGSGFNAGFSGNPFGQGFQKTTSFEAGDLFKDLFTGGGRRSSSTNYDFSHAGPEKKDLDIRAVFSVSLQDLVSDQKLTVRFPNGKTLKVKLPDYVEDGQIIRLKGQGEKSGFMKGDAFIELKFKKDARFWLEGRSVHTELFISLEEAVLGTKKEVETLDGRINISVPAWSSSDRILRLKGRGLFVKLGGRADFYVHIRIMLPEGAGKLVLEELFKNKEKINEEV